MLRHSPQGGETESSLGHLAASVNYSRGAQGPAFSAAAGGVSHRSWALLSLAILPGLPLAGSSRELGEKGAWETSFSQSSEQKPVASFAFSLPCWPLLSVVFTYLTTKQGSISETEICY